MEADTMANATTLRKRRLMRLYGTDELNADIITSTPEPTAVVNVVGSLSNLPTPIVQFIDDFMGFETTPDVSCFNYPESESDFDPRKVTIPHEMAASSSTGSDSTSTVDQSGDDLVADVMESFSNEFCSNYRAGNASAPMSSDLHVWDLLESIVSSGIVDLYASLTNVPTPVLEFINSYGNHYGCAPMPTDLVDLVDLNASLSNCPTPIIEFINGYGVCGASIVIGMHDHSIGVDYDLGCLTASKVTYHLWNQLRTTAPSDPNVGHFWTAHCANPFGGSSNGTWGKTLASAPNPLMVHHH